MWGPPVLLAMLRERLAKAGVGEGCWGAGGRRGRGLRAALGGPDRHLEALAKSKLIASSVRHCNACHRERNAPPIFVPTFRRAGS